MSLAGTKRVAGPEEVKGARMKLGARACTPFPVQTLQKRRRSAPQGHGDKASIARPGTKSTTSRTGRGQER